MTAGARNAFARRRTMRYLLAVACVLFTASAIAATDEFAERTLEPIDALLASHAWRLALRSIDSAQQDSVTAHWQDLERRRLLAYRNLPDVAALSERVVHLPPETPADFRRWAIEQLLEAALAAHDIPKARAAFEQFLAVGDDIDTIKRWRVRLVHAYLDEGRVAEARAEFAPLSTDESMRPLQAELLIRAGRDRDAFEIVAGLKSPDAALWRVVAARRLGLYAAEDVVRELALLARRLKDRPELQRIAWLVRADAAGDIGQLARRVNSLEQAFRLDPAPAPGLFAATPDDLWSAYFALARYTARSEKLTLGADSIARADAYRKTDVYTACALYAWNAAEATDADVRTTAHRRLVAALSARRLDPVVRALYTHSKHVAIADLPEGARRALMAEAVERHDLRAAAQYARDLDTPPPNESARDWNLRRARLLLYGGDEKAAIDLLERLVAQEDFDVEFARRYLQVVFDLQAMGRHREALALLDSVYTRVDNARMHRELLYWKAESAASLKRFGDAAELYLYSARFGGNDGSDRWGQSARFRAAEILAKAGMTKDAEAVYRGLLKETPDPDQRILIEQNIERLWLPAPAPTTP